MTEARFYSILIASLEDQIVELEAVIVEREQAIAVVDLARAQLLLQEPSETRNAELAALGDERAELLRDLNTNRSSVQAVQRELVPLLETQKIAAPAAEVIRQAGVPRFPGGISDKYYWVAGLLGGAFLGLVAAFFAYRLDGSVSDEADIVSSLDTNLIGSIPDLGWRYRNKTGFLAMSTGQRSIGIQRAKESYRRLRSTMGFLRSANDVRSVVITSSHPGEGKSVTSANLAIALATGGTTVALVSADMRRPSLEEVFDVDNEKGLSTYLGGQDDEITYVDVAAQAGLVFIPSGPKPANPGELLGSSRFSTLVDAIEKSVDFVIIDTPPLTSTADATSAAAAVDGVIVIVDGRLTSQSDLLRVRADLDRSGVKLLGAVMNRDRSRDVGIFRRRNRYAYERSTLTSDEST